MSKNLDLVLRRVEAFKIKLPNSCSASAGVYTFTPAASSLGWYGTALILIAQ